MDTALGDDYLRNASYFFNDPLRCYPECKHLLPHLVQIFPSGEVGSASRSKILSEGNWTLVILIPNKLIRIPTSPRSTILATTFSTLVCVYGSKTFVNARFILVVSDLVRNIARAFIKDCQSAAEVLWCLAPSMIGLRWYDVAKEEYCRCSDRYEPIGEGLSEELTMMQSKIIVFHFRAAM